MVVFKGATSLAIGALLSTFNSGVAAQTYQGIYKGGYVSQEFQSCSSLSCNSGYYCCQFSNSYRTTEVSYFCMNDFQTNGLIQGIYQDQENYPFERYEWKCG